MRFRQCMTRGMTLIKMHFVNTLKAVSLDLHNKLKDTVIIFIHFHFFPLKLVCIIILLSFLNDIFLQLSKYSFFFLVLFFLVIYMKTNHF